LVAGEPQHGLGDVGRPSDPADRRGVAQGRGHEVDGSLCFLTAEAGGAAEDGGGDRAGADGIHAHAVLAEFVRCRLGEMSDRGLGGAVVVSCHVGSAGCDARGVDDAAVTLRPHDPGGGADPEENAAQMRNGSVPGLDFDLLDAAARARHSGVVEYDIQAAKGVDRRGYRLVDISLTGNVGSDKPGSVPQLTFDPLTAQLVGVG
jgi:hypothetical protein